jgi:hypothetical protein
LIRPENSGTHEASSESRKLLVVHDDAAAIPEGIAQRRDERRARVARVSRQEFQMLGRCAWLPLHMHAPLKWNVIVGTHPRKARDCSIQGFEIREVQWVFEPLQLVP